MNPVVDGTLADPQQTIAELQRELAERTAERDEARRWLDERTAECDEALHRETATAEVLGVINSSPGDLGPVFDAMLDKAANLCAAEAGVLFTYEHEHFRVAAWHGKLTPLRNFLIREPLRAGPNTGLGSMVRERRLVHITDVSLRDSYKQRDPLTVASVELGGIRTFMAVPLLKEGSLLGAFTLYRQRVEPFTHRQIELVRTFTNQAVIAIENARLIAETREALDQQTATAEVLGVINSSPGDLAPVFDAMLDKAMRLCEAAFGTLWTIEADRFRPVAHRGVPARYAEHLDAAAIGPAATLPRTSLAGRAFHGESFAQVVDLADEELHRAGDPDRRALVDLGGARTGLAIPLRKDKAVVGVILIYRQEIRPFSDKQIALLQNFAAQAVIAIENARLITETREALEQQTATAEVLQVINSSPGDLAPVFDAMLEKAMRLCEAAFGTLWTYHGASVHVAALHNVPPVFAEFLTRGPHQVGPDSAHGRLLRGESVVHVPDIVAEKAHRLGDPIRRALVELGGGRTLLAVPLRKDNTFLGDFVIYRQEPRPFSDKQIALLQNFAAQAVIAMENARLLGELQQRTGDLQEALEYQTATSDVLKVMSGSAFELAPVLQTVVSTAVRLCRADQATIYRLEDGEYRWAADHSLAADYERIERNVRIRPGTGTLVGRVALSRDTVQILDAWTDPLYEVKEDARVGGVHTMLGVPLLREGLPIGVIGLARRRIEPYTDKETELVRTFADQAVIAVENARLLGEIRQRQAELRVTFDNMADGVVMFDENLHLAAWNRNFQELLDLPDEFLAAPHGFDDYIRYLTERGEFGVVDPEAEIARLRARFADHYSFERTRPDDTVIEVRHNPMPEGGFVLIYSDITERKRSEAEIRSARDAAEAAYHDLQAAQANLVQAQKMAALGQLTAGIAHEIKNPLNFVNNFAGLSVELLDELKEATAPAIATLNEDARTEIDETVEMLTSNLEKIAEHGQRADNIVKSMLEHSRGVSGDRRTVDLNNLIDEALNLAYHGARAQDQSFNIALERDYTPLLKPIELAPQEITRVFLNIIGNGFYAATKRSRENGKGSFHPTLSVATRDLGEAIEVKVRDNGTGIAPEIRDKLFQPFFTTKPTGEGTGLGLSISYDIVTQQHGGTIEVESRVGEFTEFIVRLPRGYGAVPR